MMARMSVGESECAEDKHKRRERDARREEGGEPEKDTGYSAEQNDPPVPRQGADVYNRDVYRFYLY